MRWLLLVMILWVLAGCANITPLEGGEKDVTPPRLDTARSSPLAATEFHPRSIRLYFDEWIRLNNVFKNVLVSPPLKYRPDIRLKGKSVIFEFDKREKLRPNTTYTINFGRAIQDITEGNAATGLVYVFSTGPVLDTLTVRGRVLDAVSRQPVQDVNVMLYDDLSDSVVYKEPPYYLGVTGKSGGFVINNMRSGTFKAFALKDADYDYKYSRPNEAIGFLDYPVIVTDSTPPLEFVIFTERPPLKIKAARSYVNGINTLELNRPPIHPEIKPYGVNRFYFLPQGDSIKIWYAGADSASFAVLSENEKIVDTLSLSPDNRLRPFGSVKLKFAKAINTKLSPKQKLILKMNLPVVEFDVTKTELRQDSVNSDIKLSLSQNASIPNEVEVAGGFQEGKNYELKIFPKGLTAVNRRALEDTIAVKFYVMRKEDLGNIFLALSPPDSTLQYVLKLKKEKETLTTELVKGSKIKEEWLLLNPGKYTLELIEDKIPNGVWDSGKYSIHQQPERIFVKNLDPLRANWDLEVKWMPEKQ